MAYDATEGKLSGLGSDAEKFAQNIAERKLAFFSQFREHFTGAQVTAFLAFSRAGTSPTSSLYSSRDDPGIGVVSVDCKKKIFVPRP